MATRQTDIRNALRDEASRYPVKATFGHGGKHDLMTIRTADGRERKFTVATTPSCNRAQRNALCSFRRFMAELKIEPRGTDG